MILKVLWIKILFIKLTNSTKHSLMLAKTGIEVLLMHEFMHLEPFIVLFQRTCPIHYFRSKTHVFEGFTPFRRCTRPVAETSIGVHLIECFRIVGLQIYYLKDFNTLLQIQNSYFGYFHTISVLYMVCFVSHHILYFENSCFGWFHAISLPHLTHCENQYRVH